VWNIQKPEHSRGRFRLQAGVVAGRMGGDIKIAYANKSIKDLAEKIV
jgi:hypothetical protein